MYNGYVGRAQRSTDTKRKAGSGVLVWSLEGFRDRLKTRKTLSTL